MASLKDYKDLKPVQQKFIKALVAIKVLVLVLSLAVLWYVFKVAI
jgi:hypothetical protein